MLLSQDDLSPFGIEHRDGGSPFLIICDHAGRLIPPSLGTLGLSDDELATHVAWDLGAFGVATHLAEALDACLIWQRYSRLVIDCNRPLTAPDSIAVLSERTTIPGNRDVTPADAAARAREVFQPYHDEIQRVLDDRDRGGRRTILVAMHSFTPSFLGVARPWHAGVLYNRDARLATPLLRALRDEGDLVVGDNEPYAVTDLSDYSVNHHGQRRGLPHVEIELRQDLLSDDAGQLAWAQRLARLLVTVTQSTFSETTES